MAVSNVKGLLQKLVAIQKIDAELFSFRREIRQKPEEIADIREKFEVKKALFHKLEARVQELELSKKARELDLKAKEQDLIKADGSLMLLKTNKEYQARLFEIENMKLDKAAIEDAVLRLMDETEKAAKALEAEKVVVADEEAKYLAEKAKIDAVVTKLTEDSADLESRRREALQGVDKEPLAMYERIVENRDGLAIVPVVDNACGGCFMHLPPQVINKLKMYDQLVRCEMCARLMYLQEDIG